MADENKQPDDLNNEELEEIAESPPAPDEYPEGQAEEAREVQPPETALEEAAIEGLEESKDAADAPIVETFAAGVDALEATIEELGERPSEPAEALAHDAHGETTVILGRELPFPIYTVVFIGLAILTLIEVILAELIYGDIKIPILVAIAVAKAYLVVYYYMHLNTDSRIFALTLALPVGIALLSALFLLAVPPGNY